MENWIVVFKEGDGKKTLRVTVFMEILSRKQNLLIL